MKKNSFFVLLIAVSLFFPAAAFAAGTDVKEATQETPSALEAPQSSPAQEPPKEVLAASETPTAPIANVSAVEKVESTTATVKTESPQVEVPAAVIAEKKTVEVQKETEDSSALNSAALEQRWKALFSKEIAPDSIAYTVKSGDSLYVLAKKNHTTVDFIKKINGLKGDNIYPKMKLKIHTAPFSIQIDKSKNVLVLYSNGEAVKKYSVATGKKNCTPVGEFKITDKLVHPTWFKTGAILPPGSSENALGTRWMGFDKPAYGIHGTIEPKSIGTQASEGCIRMLNEEVEELYSIVPVGTKVTIQD